MITDILQEILEEIKEIKRQTKALSWPGWNTYWDGADYGTIQTCDRISLIIMEKMEEYAS